MTPQFFDALIVVVIVVGGALAARRFIIDMRSAPRYKKSDTSLSSVSLSSVPSIDKTPSDPTKQEK